VSRNGRSNPCRRSSEPQSSRRPCSLAS
jgi:hypothetical protein